MIGLYYLPTPRSRKYRLAYTMHDNGLDNMRADMKVRVAKDHTKEPDKWYLAKIMEVKDGMTGKEMI